MSTYVVVVVIWQYVCPCVLQPCHDKTLGGWARGTKGEQCQANGSSTGVHGQCQTVETTTGCLPGGGRETTQKGEGWDAEMLASFHVWLIHSIKKEQPFGRDGVKWRWEGGRKKQSRQVLAWRRGSLKMKGWDQDSAVPISYQWI